jgi:cystathionine gamma-synthase
MSDSSASSESSVAVSQNPQPQLADRNESVNSESTMSADRKKSAKTTQKTPAKRGASTTAVHAGEARQKPGNALADPLFCSSTYSFAKTQDVIDYIEQKQEREEYGRYGNPGVRVVEKKLAALDRAEDAVLFSSGMAAIVGLLMAKLGSGDEVVFFDECYHRSREFCTKHLSRFGVVTRQVKACDYEAMEAAITPLTKLLVSESPTNPHLSVVDLERFAEIGQRHAIETLIDATLATPYNLRPVEYGVDYVLHSATKYLGGHNDLLAGSVAGSAERLEAVRHLRGIMGAVTGPNTAYLLQRGLKTFPLRMQRQNENGLAIARFLEQHPKVERVFYPGLDSHRHSEVARRTMTGFGSLITILIKDADWRKTADFVDAVRIPRIAPSLGGVESLIEQPMVMSYYECPPEVRQEFGIPDNMVRMSLGIEDAEDLIADLRQALDQI